MFYLMMHSTCFIYGYMVLDEWLKDHGDSQRRNLFLPLQGLFFLINTKGSYMYHPTYNIYHSLCYTSRGALTGMRSSSLSPPCRIDLTTYHTISRWSTTVLHLAPAL